MTPKSDLIWKQKVRFLNWYVIFWPRNDNWNTLHLSSQEYEIIKINFGLDCTLKAHRLNFIVTLKNEQKFYPPNRFLVWWVPENFWSSYFEDLIMRTMLLQNWNFLPWRSIILNIQSFSKYWRNFKMKLGVILSRFCQKRTWI